MTVWYAVRTNPRCEDRARRSLEGEGFTVYAPLGKKLIVHHRSRRLIERTYPLLVGYVFVEMPAAPSERHFGKTRGCDGVKHILGPCPVPRAEMALIEGAEAAIRELFERNKRAAQRSDHTWQVGQQARLARGPFAGFVGEIIDARSRKSIRLLTEILGGMVEVVAPVDDLAAAA